MPAKRRLSDDLTDLLAVPEQPEPKPTRRLDWDEGSGTGELVTAPEPADEPVDFSRHLIALGYDPEQFRILDDTIRTSVWEQQSKDGVITLRAIRAQVVARRPGVTDATALIEEIRKHKPPKRKPEATDDGGAFIYCISDTQAGKAEAPDGSGAAWMVQAFLADLDDGVRRIRELRRAGRALDECVIACLGDLVEGCDGNWYANQTWMTEWDRREQARVMRRLLLKAVERFAPLFPKVTLAAVAGNHGEHRRGGREVTGPSSNEDLAIPEQVMDIIAENPDAYGHVIGAIGGDPYVRVIEAGGHVIGMLHGHMAKESGTAQQKIARWFERQAAAKAPVSAADVILSGHYHHLTLSESNGAVTFLQVPALEGGSAYFYASKGSRHNPGTATFCLYKDNPRITDIAIL